LLTASLSRLVLSRGLGKIPDDEFPVIRKSHYFSEILGNVPEFLKKLEKFGKIWENLGKFGKLWERDLGDIPASEETVTELRRVISATEQGTSRADVH
jgi:hypothetical protein